MTAPLAVVPALALALLGAAAGPALAADRAFDGGTRGCRFADARINESSGVAASTTRPGTLWTHNDSGDTSRWFLVDGTTCATLATYRLAEAVVPPVEGESPTAIDWEDMASGVDAAGNPTLLFADIGDNAQARPLTIPPTVYEVAEPSGVLPAGVGPMDEQPVPLRAAHQLVYPGTPKDAESLLFVRQTRQLAVVTKPRDLTGAYTGASELYVAPAPLPATSGPIAMTKTADVDFRTLPRQLPAVPESYATSAGDVAPDGRHVVVRTYFDAYEWPVGPAFDLGAALRTAPLRVPLLLTRQGEGITYGLDGRSLITTSEGAGSGTFIPPGGVLDRYALLVQAPAEPPTAPPPAVVPEFPLPGVALGLAAVLGVAGIALVARRRRA